MKTVNPIKNHQPWLRGFYMILFVLIYQLVEMAIFFIAVFQFGHNIMLGEPQQKLITLGKNLSDYNYKIYMFITFNSEERPYPFEEEN